MITIICGPQACGKTRNKELLLEHYRGKNRCSRVVEGDATCEPFRDGDLVLTAGHILTADMKKLRYAHRTKSNVTIINWSDVKTEVKGLKL